MSQYSRQNDINSKPYSNSDMNTSNEYLKNYDRMRDSLLKGTNASTSYLNNPEKSYSPLRDFASPNSSIYKGPALVDLAR